MVGNLMEVRFCWNCGSSVSEFDRECCECGECGFSLSIYPYAEQTPEYQYAHERIEALERLAKYTRHSPECEYSKPPYEWLTRGGLRCSCGLDAARAAVMVK